MAEELQVKITQKSENTESKTIDLSEGLEESHSKNTKKENEASDNLVENFDAFYPEALSTLQSGETWAQVQFKKDDPVAYMAFRVWFNYPPEIIWQNLRDINKWKEIHDNYRDSRTLSKKQAMLIKEKLPKHYNDVYPLIGPESFPSNHNRQKGEVWQTYAFQVLNLPFPLKDRWNVIEITNDETEFEEGKYHYQYHLIAGNFNKLKGYWKLIPVPGKPGWTEYRGEYEADAGVSVPKFLAKGIFPKTIKKNVENNKRLLAERTGRIYVPKKLKSPIKSKYER